MRGKRGKQRQQPPQSRRQPQQSQPQSQPQQQQQSMPASFNRAGNSPPITPSPLTDEALHGQSPLDQTSSEIHILQDKIHPRVRLSPLIIAPSPAPNNLPSPSPATTSAIIGADVHSTYPAHVLPFQLNSPNGLSPVNSEPSFVSAFAQQQREQLIAFATGSLSPLLELESLLQKQTVRMQSLLQYATWEPAAGVRLLLHFCVGMCGCFAEELVVVVVVVVVVGGGGGGGGGDLLLHYLRLDTFVVSLTTIFFLCFCDFHEQLILPETHASIDGRLSTTGRYGSQSPPLSHLLATFNRSWCLNRVL